MTNKVKLNAAEVIKHMSEKELKQYNISLEKEGSTPPSKVPAGFKPYAENINILIKERNQVPAGFQEFKKENDARGARQEKVNQTISDIYNFMQSFYREFKEFKTYVLKKFDNCDQLFKEHGGIK